MKSGKKERERGERERRRWMWMDLIDLRSRRSQNPGARAPQSGFTIGWPATRTTPARFARLLLFTPLVAVLFVAVVAWCLVWFGLVSHVVCSCCLHLIRCLHSDNNNTIPSSAPIPADLAAMFVPVRWPASCLCSTAELVELLANWSGSLAFSSRGSPSDVNND